MYFMLNSHLPGESIADEDVNLLDLFSDSMMVTDSTTNLEKLANDVSEEPHPKSSTTKEMIDHDVVYVTISD